MGDVCYEGVCVQLCDATTTCAGENVACIAELNDGVAQGFSICEPHCNPASSDSDPAVDATCPLGQACHANSA